MRALRGVVAKLTTLRLYENMVSVLNEKDFVKPYGFIRFLPRLS